MNVIAEITRINQLELDKRLVNTPALWHQKYNQCDWVYYGNQPTSLSEGNIIGVMSQYGEIEDIHFAPVCIEEVILSPNWLKDRYVIVPTEKVQR